MTDGVVRVARHETERAAAALDSDGCVILRAAVSPQPLIALARRMDRDTHDLLRYCLTIGGNPRETGHLQQGPPPFRDYVFADVVMNPAVNAVAATVFGAEPRLTFYNGNTNCPGSVHQRLHMDGRHATAPGEPIAPTSSLVVDIPPVATHAGNGAIELWPGSHRVGVYGDSRVAPAQEEARRCERAPISPHTEIGDVLIRDTRLWHRGVPNRSARPRHMIALILSRPNGDATRKLRFGLGCETALEGRGADANAEYVGEAIDYLFAPTRRIYEAKRRQVGGAMGFERSRSNAK